jgi:acetyltransferase-like isoleucine patch superfamily enzyme
MFRTIWEIIKGWCYLGMFITGAGFVRKSRLKACGQRVKISPTAIFQFPECIEIGNDSFINHLCSIWASPNGRIFIGNNVLLGAGNDHRLIKSWHCSRRADSPPAR